MMLRALKKLNDITNKNIFKNVREGRSNKYIDYLGYSKI